MEILYKIVSFIVNHPVQYIGYSLILGTLINYYYPWSEQEKQRVAKYLQDIS